MTQRCVSRLLVPLVLSLLPACSFAKTVVFWQPGFPVADSPAPNEAELRAAFAGAEFANAADLPGALAAADTDLLVLPFGSAWPGADWDAILQYLDRGGNLLTLGGKPFTRAAYEDASGWHLRAESTAQTLELFIDGYQETPGSDGLEFTPNGDVFPQLAQFGWRRAFSPVVRLSVINYDATGGATGGEDMDLTTLAWGERGGCLRSTITRIGSLAGDGSWWRASRMLISSATGNCWRPSRNWRYERATDSPSGQVYRFLCRVKRWSSITSPSIRRRLSPQASNSTFE
jgi:hypothetical protein